MSGADRGRHHDPAERGFASDNHAGVHPEIPEAPVRAHRGHLPSYAAAPPPPDRNAGVASPPRLLPCRSPAAPRAPEWLPSRGRAGAP